MLRKISLAAIVLFSISIIMGCAQHAKEEGDRPTRFRQGADLLMRAGLKIGDSLPNLTAYDADGNPFKLSRLKGHYSVIVFGCLT